MTKLTDTQTMILTAGAQRAGNLAMPLPKGLHGAAAKMAVATMISHGWLQEVEASSSRSEPLWYEADDGHGTTLVVTDAGLLAIGIGPVVINTVVAIRGHAAKAAPPKPPTPRAGTKQAQIIAVIVVATSWQAHTARGMISGALKKKLGLVITTVREDDRGAVWGAVYRIG